MYRSIVIEERNPDEVTEMWYVSRMDGAGKGKSA